MTSAGPGPDQRERRGGIMRPGGNPNEFGGIAKINLSTGEILRFNVGREPSTGSVLATAGDLIFNGDINRRFRAFDAQTGKQLWESVLGDPSSVSTISYGVNGKQYIAVISGDKPGCGRIDARDRREKHYGPQHDVGVLVALAVQNIGLVSKAATRGGLD
jgi:hypothetical protein